MSLLLALVLAAHAGSYGSASVEHPGFRSWIDASVGAYSDPAQEIRDFDESMRSAQKRLDENDAALKAAFDRYATGDHAWKRLRGHLVPWSDAAPMVRAGFGVGDAWFGIETIHVDLPVAPGVSTVHQEKLAADYALAQIALLPAAPDRAADPTAASRLQGSLGASAIIGVSAADLHAILLRARQSEPELRLVATSPRPLAPSEGQADYALPGWALCRVLVAVFDGRRADAALPDLAGVPDETRANLLRFTALVLSDADLARGITALDKAGKGLSTRRDGPLADWLAALR